MSRDENELTRAAIQYCEHKGCYMWRNNSGAVKVEDRYIRYGYKGSSDAIGVTPDGRIICIEAKTEFGTVSAYQRAFLEEIQRRGGIGVVVRPSNYSDVLDAALQEGT